MPRQRRKRPRPEASATRKDDDTTAAKAAATSKQATARFGTRHTHSGSLEAAARKALTQDNVGAGPGGGDSDSGSDTGNAGKASHRRRRHAAAAASDSDSDSGGGSADDEGTGQSGMATAMAKLLGTRLADATAPVLAKRHTKSMKQVEEERAAKREKRKAAIERQHKRQRQLLRPDPTHRAPLERQLKKVATRGVVALFNAIRKSQREAGIDEDDAGHGPSQAADVSRAGFMDMLRQNEAQTSSAAAASSSAGSGSKPAWSVLRDDFMMGASLKDWGRVEHERKHGAGTSVGGLAAVVAQETTGQDEGWNAGGLDALGSDSD